MESIEKPRDCKKRACLARSAADAGSAAKRFDLTSRARATSLPASSASSRSAEIVGNAKAPQVVANTSIAETLRAGASDRTGEALVG